MLRSLPPRGPSHHRPALARPAYRTLPGPVGLLLACLLAFPVGTAAQIPLGGCEGREIFLKNYAPVTVDYAVGSDPQRFHALAPGETASYCAEEPEPAEAEAGEPEEEEAEPQAELRVRLLDSGRAYGVPPGGHHFWWIEEEGRFGLDFNSNYFIPGPPEEREYRLENRLDLPVPFRLDGKFRRLDNGRALTLTWTSRWQPQVLFRTDEGVRTYRVDEPCFAFTVVSRRGRTGFAACD